MRSESKDLFLNKLSFLLYECLKPVLVCCLIQQSNRQKVSKEESLNNFMKFTNFYGHKKKSSKLNKY